MANYSLVVNSNFKPFSYQEYIAPLATLQEQHNLIEDQLAELDAKASVFEGLANSAKDSDAYNQYKQFANELEKQRDLLSNEGLKSNTRSNLMKMKSRYAKEIVPIEQAYNRRLAQIEEQRQALLKDNSLLFSYDAADKGLNDYLRDQALSYTPVSGRQLEDEVGNAIVNYSKAVIENAEGKKILKEILPLQYEYIQQHGFSPKAITEAILNSDNSDKILKGIVDSVIHTSGIRSWNNNDKLEKAYWWARRGLARGIGETKSQMITDHAALENLRHQNAVDEIIQRRNSENGNNTIPDGDNPFEPIGNPMPIVELDLNSEIGKDYILAKDALEKYFTTDKNGNIILNNEGKEAYNTKVPATMGSNITGTYSTTALVDSNFKKLIDKLTKKGNTQLSQSEWGNAIKDFVEPKTDALENTVYRIDFEGSDQNDIAGKIMHYNRIHKLPNYKYSNKEGRYIRDEYIKLHTQSGTKYGVSGEMSTKGNYLVITSENKDKSTSNKINLEDINAKANAIVNIIKEKALQYESMYKKYPNVRVQIPRIGIGTYNDFKNYLLNQAHIKFMDAARNFKIGNYTISEKKI